MIIVPLVGSPRKIVVDVDPKTLVGSVKKSVCKMLNLPVDSFRLAVRGRILVESASLEEEGVSEGSSYYLFPGVVGG